MASPAFDLAPISGSTPSSGFIASPEPKIHSPYPETSPLGILEDPVRKLETVGKTAVDLILGLPARTMDLIFGNRLWP